MDNQFNTLVQSYRDNYIQYRITGDPKYQQSYAGAQEGIESILNSLRSSVDSGQAQISNFYKSGVEERLQKLDADNKALQGNMIKIDDELTAAKMRQPSQELSWSSIPTSKYITAGALLLGSLLVSLL
jgi:hypothetical protein